MTRALTMISRTVATQDCVGYPVNHWTRSGLIFVKGH